MPRITININAPDSQSETELLTLDLPPGLSIKDLKGIVSADTNFEPENQQFYLNGNALRDDTQTLEAAGIKDGEMLAMLVRGPSQGAQSGRRAAPGGSGGRSGNAGASRHEPNNQQLETMRLKILGDPGALQQVRDHNPALAAAVNDPVRFSEVWEGQKREEADRERERQNQIHLLNEDPFNVEAQKKIEEMIRQDRVMENLQEAYEHNPEVFGRVSMLYVDAEVNGHHIKAFVDSGAQVTIMSPSCAEACGIMRLIDTRYSGIAKGVGTANILGRVHQAEINIGGAVMACAFTVMEGKDVDLLFGLDMLKRYKAKIDLEKNALIFQGIEVPFLGEADIPKQHEEAALHEPTLKGPNGTEIGAVSGAVQPEGTAAAASSSSTDQKGKSPGQGFTAGPSTTPAASSRPAPTASNSSHTNQGPYPQKDIDALVSLGCTKDQAIRALEATGGNVDYAAGLIFDSFK